MVAATDNPQTNSKPVLTGQRSPVDVERNMQAFRGLMETPSTFENGFTWAAFLGALFVALLMVPGVMYMSLLAGQSGSTFSAAQWVTVVLFIEVARRANKNIKKAEIFTLYYLAGAVAAAPFSGLLWHQFYPQSSAAQAHGIVEHIPLWYSPIDQTVLESRNFFRVEWLPAIGLMVFSMIMTRIDNMVLGYGLFRVASDIEKLPFPMAPVGAQGVLALAEEQEEEAAKQKVTDDLQDDKPKSWRWRVFSIGSVIGLCFGVIYLGLPMITGAMLGQPIVIFPIPFVDFTQQTGDYLPAVGAGLSFDLGHLLMGMVLPWFSMVGSFIGLMVTWLANPILYHYRILNTWSSGDGMIITLFKNNIDFYFSFGVGFLLSLAGVGILSIVRVFWDIRRSAKERRASQAGGLKAMEPSAHASPAGRGDLKLHWIILAYICSTSLYILVSGYLINWHPGVMLVMLFYGFLYTPIVSYASTRLEGTAGQTVAIPLVREAAFILSGYQGVAIWFMPIPQNNYGSVAVSYRQCELTGTNFWSIWKAELVLTPIVVGAMLLFSQFIWSMGPVPGPNYPYAMTIWDLNAENGSVIYSSTLGGYSLFERAFNVWYLLIGFGLGSVAMTATSLLGWPMFLVYGLVRGVTHLEPHTLILQFIGAVLGRYYFQKKLGLSWRQYIPLVFAGFSCGMGLIAMLGIGFTFLSKSVFKLPF